VTSFKFTNADGVSRHGRFRIRPEEGTEYLQDGVRRMGCTIEDIRRRLPPVKKIARKAAKAQRKKEG